MYLVFKQSLITAINSLWATKMRSFLTMLGIIIGVGAVILIVSLGAGAQSLILNQVKTLGTNLIVILPGKSEEGDPPANLLGITVTTLNYNDYLAIGNTTNVPDIIGIVAYSKSIATVSWKNHSYDTNISGTTAGYQDVEGGELQWGRFFNKEEEKNLAKVVVLGQTASQELFGDMNPVGKKIKIKRHVFRIIGVMAKRGTIAFQDYDDQIFVPIKSAQKIISGVNHLGFIRVKVDNKEHVISAIDDIKLTLRDQHNINNQTGEDDDFTIASANDAMQMVTSITDSLKYFLAMMATLSLIVGGIGIMNIMLVSVSERTREIGLRKAIGAKRSDIMVQFLLETMAISFLGGSIGVFLGVLISYLIAVIINFLGYAWDYVISPVSIVVGLGVALIIGLFFGLYPANKASKLDPIKALKYE